MYITLLTSGHVLIYSANGGDIADSDLFTPQKKKVSECEKALLSADSKRTGENSHLQHPNEAKFQKNFGSCKEIVQNAALALYEL